MAKVLIIGGGVSGLSTGIYLQICGHQAVICEKHCIAGGNLSGWNRGEYTIDNCIHWLTGTNPATETYKMWKVLGALGDVEIMQGESLYSCSFEGKTMSLYKDLDRVRAEMLAVSPEDRNETEDLIRGVETMQGICGIGGREHNMKMSGADIVKSAPSLLKYYNLSTGELSCRFKHPLLQRFIKAFWGEDFGALAILMVFAHYCGENGGIPRGSSKGMAERMIKRFVAIGGTLLLNKEAVKVNVRGGAAQSVTFLDGEEIFGDYVVICADPATVFGKILDVQMPKKLKNRYSNSRLMRFSAIQCAFALDMKELPFRGDYIFDLPRELREQGAPIDQVIVREYSHEPSFAPEGKQILQTLNFCGEGMARRIIELKKRDPVRYKMRKKEIARVLEHAIVKEVPQMSGKLTLIDVWTPATYKRYVNSEIGSFMSFAMPRRMIPIRLSGKVDGLSNVFLATQWQQIPGGLPIAAEAGRKAALTIAKAEKKKQISEASGGIYSVRIK